MKKNLFASVIVLLCLNINNGYSLPVDCVNECCGNCSTITEITTIHTTKKTPIISYNVIEHNEVLYQPSTSHNTQNTNNTHNTHNRVKKSCRAFTDFKQDGTCVVDVYHNRDWDFWVDFSKKGYRVIDNNDYCSSKKTRYEVTNYQDCLNFRERLAELRNNRNNRNNRGSGGSISNTTIINYYNTLQPYIHTYYEYVPIITYEFEDIIETIITEQTICDYNGDGNGNGGDGNGGDGNGGVAPVPEPSTMLLFGIGMSSFIYSFKKRKNKK